MTGLQALTYFTLELSRASSQLGIAPPQVHGVRVDQLHPAAHSNYVAYVVPGRNEVEIQWWALWGYSKKTLRCVARHEALHLALHHDYIHSRAEGIEQHEQVDFLLDILWREPKNCGLR